jgi:hypothetical protein
MGYIVIVNLVTPNTKKNGTKQIKKKKINQARIGFIKIKKSTMNFVKIIY